MRTALILLPVGSDEETFPRARVCLDAAGDLVAALEAMGAERIGVIVPPGLPLQVFSPSIDVLEVMGTGQALQAISSYTAGAETLDLVAGDLVLHRALLELVLHPPGAGTTALVTDGTLPTNGKVVDVVDGTIVDVKGAGSDAAASHRWFAGVLHLGLRSVGELQDVLAALLCVANDLPSGNVAPSHTPGAGSVHDLPELLLTGLVRKGVVVGAVPSGAFVVRRVAAPADLEAARQARDAVDEERVRLARAVKDRDGFFTTFFVSPYSKYVARWFARRGASPNQVTVGSLVFGLLAAGSFAMGSWWWLLAGAVLLQVSFTLDCVDGQLARYTRAFSAFGAWLDAVFDRTKEYAVYGGLAVGAVRQGDAGEIWWLAGAALALQTLRHHLDFAYAAQREQVSVRPRTGPLTTDELLRVSRPAAGAEPQGSGRARGLTPSNPLLRAAAAVGEVAGLRWLKSIVILPIGERFALISAGAILLGPSGTFVALLAWGGLALVYLAVGRLLRTAS